MAIVQHNNTQKPPNTQRTCTFPSRSHTNSPPATQNQTLHTTTPTITKTTTQNNNANAQRKTPKTPPKKTPDCLSKNGRECSFLGVFSPFPFLLFHYFVPFFCKLMLSLKKKRLKKLNKNGFFCFFLVFDGTLSCLYLLLFFVFSNFLEAPSERKIKFKIVDFFFFVERKKKKRKEKLVFLPGSFLFFPFNREGRKGKENGSHHSFIY